MILIGLMTFLFESKAAAQKKIKQESDNNIKKSKRVLYGLASFYANKFEGNLTANGEVFRHSKLTAACNVLPLGSWIKVTNLKNKKVVIVKTNDRLHPNTRRLIDLTKSAAKKLGFLTHGLTRVKVEILDQKSSK